MILTKTNAEDAVNLLEQAKGHVREAIQISKGGTA